MLNHDVLSLQFFVLGGSGVVISKEQIHLFQGFALSLWIEEEVAKSSDDVEDEEYVEIAKPNICECRGSELCKNQVESPVGKGCH